MWRESQENLIKDKDMTYSVEGWWESRFGKKRSILHSQDKSIKKDMGSWSSSVSSNLSGTSIILKD